MSPRELDADVVQARLELIRELLADLTSAGVVTAERLRRERMLRHAVERILTQIVDLAVSVNSHIASTQLRRSPNDYRSSFALVESAGVLDHDLAERLSGSVGLRNVLTHEYVTVDLSIVAAAAVAAPAEYDEYVRMVASWLRERSAG